MPHKIIKFWFEDINPTLWWSKDETFDQRIRDEYSVLHAAASRCELFSWRDSALGRLAEILILDQFSRNMYRGQPESFASDSLALGLAQEAVRVGADLELEPMQRSFLYMPYMHSESLLVHEVAVELFRNNGIDNNYDFELKHKAIVERFGRYPHRNKILGRESTPEEAVFLQQPGSGF